MTGHPAQSLMLLFGSLFGGALAIGGALFFWQRYANPDPSLLRLRLDRMKKSDTTRLKEVEDTPKINRFYKESEYKNESLGRQLEKLAFFRKLKLRMLQAGIKTPPDTFFVNNIVFPTVLLGLLGIAMGAPSLLMLAPMIAAGTYAFVLIQRKKRYDQFISQLPDALSMLTSALRAGHSFQSALVLLSTEMAEPIGLEFAFMVRDVNLGIPVRDALVRLVNRMNELPDVCMFATAVTIQREAGGNLAEVLENLSRTIRERFKLRGQIAALTGQSRLTGYVLGAAPVTLLVGLSIFMYGYVKPLYETEVGHLALLVSVLLQAVGFVVIRRIIDIRV